MTSPWRGIPAVCSPRLLSPDSFTVYPRVFSAANTRSLGDEHVNYLPARLVTDTGIDFNPKWLYRFDDASAEVTSVDLSENGRVLAGGDSNGAVHLWMVEANDPDAFRTKLADKACQRLSRNLSYVEWDRFLGREQPYCCNCPEFPAGIGVPQGQGIDCNP